jgi:ankyrin repeat protein
MQLLINAGSNLNTTDIHGRTSLIYASSLGHYDIVIALIRAGANVNAANIWGKTALMNACCDSIATRCIRNITPINPNYVYIIEALLQAGADVGMTNVDGKTVLDLAAESTAVEQQYHVLLSDTHCRPY